MHTEYFVEICIIKITFKNHDERVREMKRFLSEGIALGNTDSRAFSLGSVDFKVNTYTVDRLQSMWQGEALAVENCLYTAFAFLLSKYSREEELVIEKLLCKEDGELPFEFVSLRTRIEVDKSFKDTCLQSTAPISAENSTDHSIVFDMQTVAPEALLAQAEGFGLCLQLLEEAGAVKGSFRFNGEIFEEDEIQRFCRHYLNILKQAAENPDMLLGELELLSSGEKETLLTGFNDTEAAYAIENTIHGIFEVQAEQTPEGIAVVFGEQRLTYRELNKRANSLAGLLRSKGIGAEDVVGLVAERSLELVTGILGILKAGAAYLPVNPEYPRERIHYMLEDSKAKAVLAQGRFIDLIETAAEVINLEEATADMASNMEPVVASGNAAYVIYTSGSTGNPKGVVVEHRALHNFLNTIYNRFGRQVGIGDRCLSLTNISFDVSVCEIFLPLIYGGTLVLFNNDQVLDVEKLAETIVKEKITFAYIPPAILKKTYELLATHRQQLALNKLLVGVEPIQDTVLEAYLSLYENMQIINGYGPTEATICATMFNYRGQAPKGKNVPIGSPLLNTQIYLLDSSARPVPVGVPGEVCISGDNLARGYLYRPELTAEKFVPNPFRPGSRMYKTGDLARWRPDGNIEFLGRMDLQVKIRGYRVELGEIENQLLKLPSVKETVVIDRQDDEGSKVLCAYVVADEEISVRELREKLSQSLPDYMLPSYFIQIDKIPLTLNGKTNKKALPEPAGRIHTGIAYAAPANAMEEKLAALWREVLELESIGVEDDFFLLGGHSLKAMKLVSLLQKELAAQVSVGDVFGKPTVRQLAAYLSQAEGDGYPPIEPGEERTLYQVSSAQKRMFALHQLSKEETSYNIPYMLILEGKLDTAKAEDCFRRLLQRHEALRTSFELDHNEIVQRIHREVEFKLEYIVLEEASEEAKNRETERFVRPFDLSAAPLLRARLVKLGEEKYLLMLDMHHIIGDGSSVAILLAEFAKLYNGKALEALKVQYKDYALWEQQLLNSKKLKAQEEYWLGIFQEEIPVLNLPVDYPRPNIQRFEGERLGFVVDKTLTYKLKELSRAKGVTLYMTLLAAYNLLLSKYSGQEDMIVGSAVAGRPLEELQNMVGMFVNTLAIRNHPEGGKTFEEFLQEVKQNALKAYEHQDYPFDRLAEKLQLQRDLSRNVLFDAMFVLQNTDTKEIALEGIEAEEFEYRGSSSRFDITLEAEEKGEELRCHLEYCTKLFKQETAARMIRHFIYMLEQVAEQPKKRLEEISMVLPSEKEELLYGFNDTQAAYTRDKAIHQLFEEQVERTPDQQAVVYQGRQLTYRELNTKANRLARSLQQKGVKDQSIVGIMAEGSLEMIIGILAVLKAGGAYLPIDSKYPKDRIDYMLQDSGSKLLLTDFQPEEKLGGEAELLLLKEASLYQGDGNNLEAANNPSGLAYVIYTSGSTGKPKGVMIEQGSLVNMCQWNAGYYGITATDGITKYAGFGFDASVWEIFPTLISGAVLHIIPEAIKLDLEKLNDYYNDNGITISFLPTQIAEQFMKLDNHSLRYLQAAGDKLRSYQEKPYKVVNNYGPTENTVVATCFVIDKLYDNIPIGKPTANTQLYILDRFNRLQPVGVPGELCIGGVGLARGYLNNAALTAEKFIASPFAEGQRLYKTGDLARWLPDGNLEFLGRIDQQVKIRGYRVELGEIENSLLKLEGVREAVVLDKGDAGSKYLCAYLVSEVEHGSKWLREELKKSLPDYMIPAYFVALPEIPMNQNGKIDRKALPAPYDAVETGEEFVAAATETEQKLLDIWQEVLGVEGIGANHNFFELGGHSLKAIRLVSMIQKELLAEVSVGEVFNNPTVRELGAYIGKNRESLYSDIEPVAEQGLYPVSSAQKRMFAFHQFSKKETNYNIPSLLLLEGVLAVQRLEACFRQLVQRHEAFRTSFEMAEDEIVQKIHGDIAFKMDYQELDSQEESLIESEIKAFIEPFDLGQAPLLRVKLMRLAPKKHLLMFDMHHIISDGTSMNIFTEEFARLYKGEPLEELRIQYKDYAVWENRVLASEAMKEQEAYWTHRFGDELPVLNLPMDYPRPGTQSFEGESISFVLDELLSRKLKKLSQSVGGTLYMTLLAAYNILLSKYSGQEDIVVGSPIAGRSHADLYNIMGMFVNTLAMRNHPDRKKSFREFLLEVKKNALAAYENQDYQFDKLVEKLNIKRDLSRNAIFDTMFTLQNTGSAELQLEGIHISPYPFERGVSKFDITLSAEEKGEEIQFELEYCSRLFKRESIQKMIGHFKNILMEVVRAPELKLYEIDMLSSEEKKELLVDFNSTETPYEAHKTICQCFQEQAESTPDHPAVFYEGKSLTYRELNMKANQLARILREKGVLPDSIVGILMERSLEMIIGIMGILKAGGAYLPISPDYPEDRIRYMLEDSKTELLLTQGALADPVRFEGTVINLEEEQLYQGAEANPEILNTPQHLAYVIYTSGSTGRPKGVMIQHGSVVNLVRALGEAVYDRYKEPLRVTMIAPYVFDASVKQIFASLLKGHCLCIVPEDYRNIGEKLAEYYIKNQIDISDGTPSHFKLILGDNRELIRDVPVRHFIIGGEALPVDVVKDFLSFFQEEKPCITNIYGPTECCVDSTAFLVDAQKLNTLGSIPIGRPLANYKVYVLDKEHMLQAIGVAGELCIAGEGLARGYLNKPELTAEKFAANPFEPGEKMYKTGDLVRWLPDGNIEFLGRMDHQIKIRGYRIEIGEIEALIKSYPAVRDGIVIVHTESGGEKLLAAYIVPETEAIEPYNESALKEYLKKQLPQYMVPALLIKLDSLPLNNNGKIDRFALPKPELLRGAGDGYVAPRSKEEVEMAQIWAKTLGIEKIGIDDDFFDIGGDSFKAIKLVRSISKDLGVMELFKNPTIRQLTVYLAKDTEEERVMLHELTKPLADKDRRVSLVCFPYGGGSAISYQALAGVLPKGYSLYSVELPGHDYSRPEEALTAIEDSAARCLAEIKQKVKGPIVLYGHCLGATMAAFLAYELEAAGIQVEGVFVGAMFPSPRISNWFFNAWNKIFPYKLTDKGNRDMLKTIGGLNQDVDPKETEFILKNLKHDSAECEKWYTQVYEDKQKGRFKAPITCVIGEGDRVTEFYQERYREWEHFSDQVDLKTIPNAGHFFFKNQAAELSEIIQEKVELWQKHPVTEARQSKTVAQRAAGKKAVVPSMNLFLIVAIVQIISEIGSILSTFGTGIWVYQQTNALSQFAMMLLFGIVPTILILPISGAIVDRFDRRLIIIAGDILAALSALGLLLLLATQELQIWQVYVFTVVSSLASCFRQPAYLAAITQITPKMYLAQANSVSQFSTAIGGILASICGGLFMHSIGFRGLVAIDLATFVISITVLLFIRFPDTMFTRLEESIRKELLGGWNFIVKRKSMVVMVAFFLVANFLGSIFDVTMTPLILTFTNPSMLGFINAFAGMGVLAGAVMMLVTGGTKKRAKGMVGFVVPLAVSMFIAGVRPLPAVAAAALFGVAFSITAVNVHWQSLIQVKVGLELQGRVFAINRMMVAVLTPISYITAGVLADKVFAPMMSSGVFESPLVSLILGAGAGREMRLNLLLAGTVLLAWSILGLRYRPLSEMDDILADAAPGEIIIRDKDKLQEMADQRIKAAAGAKAGRHDIGQGL